MVQNMIRLYHGVAFLLLPTRRCFFNFWRWSILLKKHGTLRFPNLSVFYLRMLLATPLVGTRSTNAHPPVVQAPYGYDEGQDVDGEFLELSESPPPPPARDTVWRTANRATPDALKATPVPVRSSARQREKRLRESEQQLGGRVLNFQDPPLSPLWWHVSSRKPLPTGTSNEGRTSRPSTLGVTRGWQPAPRELELLVIVVAKMFVFCSFSVSYIVIVTLWICVNVWKKDWKKYPENCSWEKAVFTDYEPKKHSS